jgi:hypothetical protein
MMNTPILKSDGERNNMAAARVTVPISVTTRIKMHAFEQLLAVME